MNNPMPQPYEPMTYDDCQPNISENAVENHPTELAENQPETPCEPLDTDPPTAPPGLPSEGAPIGSTPGQSALMGGAPENNAHHLTHGLNADPAKQYVRLKLGSLPKSLARVETDSYEYRVMLENAVAVAHGEISLTHAHAVDTAVRWFRHGQAALSWLRKHGDEMTADQRLAYSKAIAESADKRDKAIDRLKLGAAAKSIFDLASVPLAQ